MREWIHMLVKGVRLKTKTEGNKTRHWLVIFSTDVEGNDRTWSSFVNARGNRASFSGPLHLMMAYVKDPRTYLAYVKAVKEGNAALAEELRDKFYERCRKAALNFARAESANDPEKMAKVAGSVQTHLQGRVFLVCWEQDGRYGKPASHVLAMSPPIYDFTRDEQPFGDKLVADIVDEFENSGFSFEESFADAQCSIVEAGAQFDEAYGMLQEQQAPVRGVPDEEGEDAFADESDNANGDGEDSEPQPASEKPGRRRARKRQSEQIDDDDNDPF